MYPGFSGIRRTSPHGQKLGIRPVGDSGTTQAGAYAAEWNPLDGSWSLLEEMPTLRTGLTLTALGDFRVTAFGGSDEDTGDIFS